MTTGYACSRYRLAVSEIEFRSDVTVELVRASAHDSDVLFAARVSTQGEQTLTKALLEESDGDAPSTGDAGLINYLWPLLIVLLSAHLPGAPGLRAGHLGGAALGLAGVAALFAGRGGFEFAAGALPG